MPLVASLDAEESDIAAALAHVDSLVAAGDLRSASSAVASAFGQCRTDAAVALVQFDQRQAGGVHQRAVPGAVGTQAKPSR